MGNGTAGRPFRPVGKRPPPAKGEQPGGEIRLDRLSGGVGRRPPVCCPWRLSTGIVASLIYGDTAMPPGQFRGLEAFFTRLFRPSFRLNRGSSYQTATVRLRVLQEMF